MEIGIVELVSVKNLSEITQIPEKTLRDWILKKKMPCVYKVGRLIRINLSEFRAWYREGRLNQLTPEIVKVKIG